MPLSLDTKTRMLSAVFDGSGFLVGLLAGDTEIGPVGYERQPVRFEVARDAAISLDEARFNAFPVDVVESVSGFVIYDGSGDEVAREKLQGVGFASGARRPGLARPSFDAGDLSITIED